MTLEIVSSVCFLIKTFRLKWAVLSHYSLTCKDMLSMWSSWKLSLKLGSCPRKVVVMCLWLVVCSTLQKKIDIFYEENYFIKCPWNYLRCLCDGSESESSIEHFVGCAAKAAVRPWLASPLWLPVWAYPACFELWGPNAVWHVIGH